MNPIQIECQGLQVYAGISILRILSWPVLLPTFQNTRRMDINLKEIALRVHVYTTFNYLSFSEDQLKIMAKSLNNLI